MNLELDNKLVALTGPAKGMGETITRAFAAEGANLVLLARDTKSAERLAQQLEAEGTTASVHGCDITNFDQCEQAIREAGEQHRQPIDILVNIAGGSGPMGQTGLETDAHALRAILDTNLVGCANTMRAVLPGMIDSQHGQIVNVGGTFGMRGRAYRSAYSASKWGLRGLTKSFALEVGQHNINVNIVAPGMVDGPRFRDKVCRDIADREGLSLEQAATRHCEDYALGRVSTASDIADACLFLSSPRARQITGADLAVDGGWATL